MRIFGIPSSQHLTPLLIGSLGVFLTVAAIAVGAALFSWLGPEEEPSPISLMESPNLSESQVLSLVGTYFDTKAVDTGIYEVCLDEGGIVQYIQIRERREGIQENTPVPTPGFSLDRIFQNFQALSASYQGDGLWVVSNERCTFIVDDGSGRVVPP